MLLTLLQRSVQPHTTMNNLGQNKKPWCQVMLPPWTNHVHGAKGPTGVSFLCACYTGSVVSDSVRPYGLQPIKAPLSMGFPRQEYWIEIKRNFLKRRARRSLCLSKIL